MYLLKILGQISDFCLQIFGKYIKIEGKNLQFYGVKQSKIRWMVVEIKFIKSEKFKIKVIFLGQLFDFSFAKFF